MEQKSWKNHGILLTNSYLSGISAATRQLFKIQLTCMLIKRSWNFVIWSGKNHGKVMEFCHNKFMATLLCTSEAFVACLKKKTCLKIFPKLERIILSFLFTARHKLLHVTFLTYLLHVFYFLLLLIA